MNWSENINELLAIAKSAGDAILEIYETEDFGIEQKSDASPLTKADQKANDIICEGLLRLFPDIPIVSEENKEIPYEERKDYNFFWCVDPLDGTKEFIKKNGEFTVNIALINRDTVWGGIVYTPVTDEMYFAFKDDGAHQIIDGKKMILKANSFEMKDEGLAVVCSRSHLNEATSLFVGQLNAPNLVSKGSSLKFMILASGGAELYPRLAPTMEWDTAAAQIILEEAGGKVIDDETGEPLKYNKEILRNPHFVAYARLEA